MDSSNSYTPLDLSAIKSAQINSDKDLEIEITKICEVLKDTCMSKSTFQIWISLTHFIETFDWKKRTESLHRVQEISVLYLKIASGESRINPTVYLN